MTSKLKGQLGLKSGPLAPTSSKLTTQYLVLDHMNNHFNKIAKAKSAIDTRPPKSLTTSQKMRDRKNRTRLSSNQNMRPMSAMTAQEIQQYEELLDDEPEDDEERLVHSIMKSTLIEKSKTSNNATYGSESATYLHDANTYMSQHGSPYYSQSRTMNRPLSARSTRSVASFTNALRTSMPVKSHDQTRITYAGDILEKRAHKFTEPERPFTPRINHSSHESRLKSSKCYNPPKPKQNTKKSGNIYAYRESKAAREVRHNRNNQKSSIDPGETLETGELSESMLMDITLRSRDARHETESDGQVPPLDISMDKDHLNWLQEQASKAKVRARSGAQIPKAHLMGDITPIAEERSACSSGSMRTETKMK